ENLRADAGLAGEENRDVGAGDLEHLAIDIAHPLTAEQRAVDSYVVLLGPDGGALQAFATGLLLSHGCANDGFERGEAAGTRDVGGGSYQGAVCGGLLFSHGA